MVICGGDTRGHHYNTDGLENAGSGAGVVLIEGREKLSLILWEDCSTFITQADAWNANHV